MRSHRVAMVKVQSSGWGELLCVLLDMVTLAVSDERLILSREYVTHRRETLAFAQAAVGK
jgi:hypothetical protein